MTEPDPLDAFRTANQARFIVHCPIHYDDLDPNRHVNHARYLGYLEECRLALRRQLNTDLALPESLGWAVGALSIQYRRALLYPAIARVEAQPISVGRTSFSLGYGVFDDQGCAAVASTRSVCLDETGRPTPLPVPLAEWLRARLV